VERQVPRTQGSVEVQIDWSKDETQPLTLSHVVFRQPLSGGQTKGLVTQAPVTLSQVMGLQTSVVAGHLAVKEQAPVGRQASTVQGSPSLQPDLIAEQTPVD
jgi:hypothetical protein